VHVFADKQFTVANLQMCCQAAVKRVTTHTFSFQETEAVKHVAFCTMQFEPFFWQHVAKSKGYNTLVFSG
jgi:hypothetical protein